MRSPFPGMDPYLETRWGDVHSKLCAFVGEALQAQLPGSLRARTESRVLLEEESEELPTRYTPDTSIFETDAPRGRTIVASEPVTLEPVILIHVGDTQEERWVQIIDVESGNRVVTAIEILSRGNKVPGRLNNEYRQKIEDYVAAGVNIVEIDLLRGRRHGLRVQHERLPRDHDGEYLYSVLRARKPYLWQVYAMRLRNRLPVLPVPLRKTDADVTLDLQALIDRIYTAGGHDDIDYRLPASPALWPADLEWFAGRLAQRGQS